MLYSLFLNLQVVIQGTLWSSMFRTGCSSKLWNKSEILFKLNEICRHGSGQQRSFRDPWELVRPKRRQHFSDKELHRRKAMTLVLRYLGQDMFSNLDSLLGKSPLPLRMEELAEWPCVSKCNGKKSYISLILSEVSLWNQRAAASRNT